MRGAAALRRGGDRRELGRPRHAAAAARDEGAARHAVRFRAALSSAARAQSTQILRMLFSPNVCAIMRNFAKLFK